MGLLDKTFFFSNFICSAFFSDNRDDVSTDYNGISEYV